jgi:hypothetical protein
MLSVNRLLEMSETRAKRCIEMLLEWSNSLLVYQYPGDSAVPDLSTLADRFGLRVRVRTPHVVIATGLGHLGSHT